MLRAKVLEHYSSPSWAYQIDPTQRHLQIGLTPGWSTIRKLAVRLNLGE
jgi:hypothetical protein